MIKFDKTTLSKKGIWGVLMAIGLELAKEYGPDIWKNIKAYWRSKNVAILGATNSGKDAFLARLRGEEIPLHHFTTDEPEPISNFKIDYNIGNGETICFHVKEGMNVGGENFQVERYWNDACQDADVIFYLIDTNELINEITSASLDLTNIDTKACLKNIPLLKRLSSDMDFLATPLAKKGSSRLVIILNKIDLPLENAPGDILSEKVQNYANELQYLQEAVKIIAHNSLNNYKSQLTGVMPLSCKNTEMFTQFFPTILKNVAGA